MRRGRRSATGPAPEPGVPPVGLTAPSGGNVAPTSRAAAAPANRSGAAPGDAVVGGGGKFALCSGRPCSRAGRAASRLDSAVGRYCRAPSRAAAAPVNRSGAAPGDAVADGGGKFALCSGRHRGASWPFGAPSAPNAGDGAASGRFGAPPRAPNPGDGAAPGPSGTPPPHPHPAPGTRKAARARAGRSRRRGGPSRPAALPKARESLPRPAAEGGSCGLEGADGEAGAPARRAWAPAPRPGPSAAADADATAPDPARGSRAP